MPNVHKIQITDDHPRAYHPDFGDVLQFYLSFPVGPDAPVVSDIGVSVQKHEGGEPNLVVIGVMNTSTAAGVGAHEFSVFLFVKGPGLHKVRLVPVIEGQKPEEYEIAVLPNEPRK